jgi:type VI secretion system protein ImpM
LNDASTIPGLYGKLPARGDFVTRRLTPGFVETWDAWLQSAMSASKQQLGTQWLEIYLTSPIWHFALSPGVCGGSRAWIGILMPSVDKVGRYFPLTLATALENGHQLLDVFMSGDDWFEQMEQLALSALEETLDLTELDSKLQAQLLPDLATGYPTPHGHPVDPSRDGRLAFHMPLQTLQHLPAALARLGFDYLAQAHAIYSLWATSGSESMQPCLRVYDRLPPMDAFSDLLVGSPESIEDGIAMEETPEPSEPDRPTELCEWPDDDRIEIPRIQWYSSAGTNVGKHRKINEDAYLESPDIGLWAVADGMGGHSAGDVASQCVIDALGTLVATGNLDSFTAYTTECLHTVNTDLLEMAGDSGEDRIIGSTVVVMLAVGWRCASIWAGDSRLYQFRDGKLTQLTQDHSMTAELSLQDAPPGDASEAETASNIVTRALGAESDVTLDVITFDAQVGDRYLLCSDGLIKEVQHHEIEDILKQEACRESAQRLIELALQRDARDNITVVVAQAGQTGSSESCEQ